MLLGALNFGSPGLTFGVGLWAFTRFMSSCSRLSVSMGMNFGYGYSALMFDSS